MNKYTPFKEFAKLSTMEEMERKTLITLSWQAVTS
jgi:hypothetical protein